MALVIEGLRDVPQPPVVANITDHLEANLEALRIIGMGGDWDKIRETVTAGFLALEGSGRTGEALIQIPRRIITLQGLLDVTEGLRYGGKDYPKAKVWDNLWTPGTELNSYTAEELDNLTLGGDGDFEPQVRLAIYNESSDKRIEEPLLHFLGQPYDVMYAKKGQLTQPEAITKAVKEYEAEEGHEDFAMSPLNAKAVAWIALVRHIKGEQMPMNWGHMRDATLPPKRISQKNCVGYIFSCYGRLCLDKTGGGVDSTIGVGLSVG